eukprot:7527590-Alexandrium_andersonii.AAC.1
MLRRWLAPAGGFNIVCDAFKSAALHQHMSVLPQACGAEHTSCVSHDRRRVCALRAGVVDTDVPLCRADRPGD